MRDPEIRMIFALPSAAASADRYIDHLVQLDSATAGAIVDDYRKLKVCLRAYSCFQQVHSAYKFCH